MDTAIWIKLTDRDAWLVELIPTLANDDHPDRPVAFNPGRSFRHRLNLIASNREGLERAIRADQDLARAIADGEVLHGDVVGQELQEIARSAHGNPAAR